MMAESRKVVDSLIVVTITTGLKLAMLQHIGKDPDSCCLLGNVAVLIQTLYKAVFQGRQVFQRGRPGCAKISMSEEYLSYGTACFLGLCSKMFSQVGIYAVSCGSLATHQIIGLPRRLECRLFTLKCFTIRVFP